MNSILESVDAYITNLSDYNKQLVEENARLQVHTPSNLLISALHYMSLGVPYVFGAELENNNAFDCSSFMQRVFKDNGISIPRTSRKQAEIGVSVEKSRLGDLVVFDTNKDGIVNHVGMAISETLMIHTANPVEKINVCNYRDRYGKGLVSIRRVVE